MLGGDMSSDLVGWLGNRGERAIGGLAATSP